MLCLDNWNRIVFKLAAMEEILSLSFFQTVLSGFIAGGF